jgi:hypothetical protein
MKVKDDLIKQQISLEEKFKRINIVIPIELMLLQNITMKVTKNNTHIQE